MINIREIFSKFDPDASTKVVDKTLIETFIKNPHFPYLVSFPRTGSHWLRMLMELYFEKPALIRIFYYRNSKDFTCYHTHDEDLSVKRRKNVLYLYRDPVDTVYSQIKYYNEDITDDVRVESWSKLYAKHLVKWLYDDKYSKKKTIITYEGLKADSESEFKKVADHFEINFDVKRFATVAAQVTKKSLKKKTVHDKKVVNLNNNYENYRIQFRALMGNCVREAVLSIDRRLVTCFS